MDEINFTITSLLLVCKYLSAHNEQFLAVFDPLNERMAYVVFLIILLTAKSYQFHHTTPTIVSAWNTCNTSRKKGEWKRIDENNPRLI